jgi:hypothetical protein
LSSYTLGHFFSDNKTAAEIAEDSGHADIALLLRGTAALKRLKASNTEL